METYFCLKTSNFLGYRLIYARSDLYVRPTITYYFDCCKTVNCWPEVSEDVRKDYFHFDDQLE